MTRVPEDNQKLGSLLQAAGAEILELPTVAIAPPDDLGPLDEALTDLDQFDWIIFTSRNAVRSVLDRISAPFPPHLHVAAVGASTARLLRERGLSVDLVSPQPDSTGLAAALVGTDIARRRVLVPQGDLAHSDLGDALTEAGAIVETVTAYRTVRPPADGAALERLRQSSIDAVVLASPSALHNLLDMLGDDRDLLVGATFVCIGRTTAEAAVSNSFERVVIAAAPTDEALFDAILTTPWKADHDRT